MRQPIVAPVKFAEWFNSAMPGAYGKVSIDDISDMASCGLIGRYGFYGRADLETVRAILQYEKLHQNRMERLTDSALLAVRRCKLCGNVLPAAPSTKHGRKREYCATCESLRAKKRYQKWRDRRLAHSTRNQTEMIPLYN